MSGPQAALSTSPKLVYRIRPLQDPRWNKLVEKHPRASLFHSSAWLAALSKTYGYEPVAYTTSPSGSPLDNAIVFCQVKSWLTGRRLVSLPFSDHCEPLVEQEADCEALGAMLHEELRRDGWRYLEIRPLGSCDHRLGLRPTTVDYCYHEVDLGPDLATLFSNLHKNSIQRKIRRAERERLRYVEGSNDALLDNFHALMTLTRKRHRLPPQPRKWFANLMANFGDALKIRVAFHGEIPVAAMMTIRHKATMVYKYGCSDLRFNNLGSMPLLYWKTIEDAKSLGCEVFDLGRTDADQQGLITFKNRWNAAQFNLRYLRYSLDAQSTHSLDLKRSEWKSRTTKYILGHFPTGLLSLAGRILYRHSG